MKAFLPLVMGLFLAVYLLRLATVSRLVIPENRSVKVVGRISIQPYLKDSYQVIKIGQITVLAERFPGYFYGQNIEVFGSFEQRALNPLVIRYYSSFPAIRVLENDFTGFQFGHLKKVLLQTRGYLEERVGLLLPEPESGLLLGIVLGARKNLPEYFRQSLQDSGTVHLVVASGQNLVLLAGIVLESLLLLFRRRVAVVMGLLVVWIYVLLVGAEAPVVRAGIMVGLAMAGQLGGRVYQPALGLFAAAGLMLLVSPLILFDVGFQLSFAATGGIIWFYPLLERCLKRLALNLPVVVKESLLTSISAQVLTTPIIALTFGRFSWTALPANLLVLPTIPLLMELGLLVITAAAVCLPLAQPAAWLVYPLLWWFVKVVEWLG